MSIEKKNQMLRKLKKIDGKNEFIGFILYYTK